MTDTYLNNARGWGVNCDTALDFSKIPTDKLPNFLTITGYNGLNQLQNNVGKAEDALCSAHIDEAYKNGIPAVIMFRVYQDTWQGWVNDPTWGDMSEWNSCVLDNIVWINKAEKIKRKISAIIIDARGVSVNLTTKPTVMTQGNWVRGMKWFTDNAWTQYGIQLFVLMNQTDINKMPVDADNAAVNFLSNLNKPEGDTTCVNIASLVTPATGLPYPVDSWKPLFMGSATRVWFSYYSNKYLTDGITVSGTTKGVDLWQYDKAPAAMYSELGFTPSVTPVTSGSGIDTATINTQLDQIILLVNQIKAEL